MCRTSASTASRQCLVLLVDHCSEYGYDKTFGNRIKLMQVTCNTFLAKSGVTLGARDTANVMGLIRDIVVQDPSIVTRLIVLLLVLLVVPQVT
jgi:hypothetical protein